MTELKHTLDDLCTNLLITSTCNAGCSWCIANDYMKEQIKKFIKNKEEIIKDD